MFMNKMEMWRGSVYNKFVIDRWLIESDWMENTGYNDI